MACPKISVLMPTCNSAKYLAEAIESILEQSFTDFEFLVIDDASTDITVEILRSYADKRIVLLQGPNKGLAAALNYGLSKARGQYIARMDADVIAVSSRFEKQVAYLDRHSDIGVCGTVFQEFMFLHGIDIQLENIRYADLLSGCYIEHPTAMFRRELFSEHSLFYDETLQYGEDYDLWARAVRVTRLGNIQEKLLQHRRQAENAPTVSMKTMTGFEMGVKILMIEYLVGRLSAEEKSLWSICWMEPRLRTDRRKIWQQPFWRTCATPNSAPHWNCSRSLGPAILSAPSSLAVFSKRHSRLCHFLSYHLTSLRICRNWSPFLKNIILKMFISSIITLPILLWLNTYRRYSSLFIAWATITVIWYFLNTNSSRIV